MKDKIRQLLILLLEDLGIKGVNPVVEFTSDLRHGDYTTNVAMVLAARLHQNSVEIAKEIVSKFKVQSSKFKVGEQDHLTTQSGQKISDKTVLSNALQDIENVEVVTPGFINFRISASILSKQLEELLMDPESVGKAQTGNGKTYMIEFAHPNTHKAFHIGHLFK